MLFALLFLSSISIQVHGFSFSYTSPTQCDPLTISWAGGTAPFYLFVTPFFSTLQNITIPDSAFNGTHGSFTTTLRVTGKENQGRFLLTMSDVTGVGSGGTSGVLTVGTGSGSCNTTDPGTAFTYSLDRSLQQCRPYIWSSYGDAVQPVTITGLIPLGKTFTLNPPQGADSYTWTTNVATGTNVVFTMVDAQGRQGGVTDLYTVSASDDTSCITSDSPSSTAQSTAATSATATSTPTATPSAPSSNGAVIGSSIAGGTVLLVLVASLVWFFLHKNKKRGRDEEDESSIQGINGAKRRGRSVDLIPDDQSGRSGAGAIPRYPLPSPHTGDPLAHDRGRSVYDPDPYVLPPPSEAHSYFGDGASIHDPEPIGSRHTRVMSNSTSMSGMTKAQMAAASTSGSVRSGPQRFVLHTDAGEVDDDDDVVELPPMYTQVQPRRAPPSTTGAPSGSDTVNDPLRS